eukprot:CAMPEP_0204610764 /NCGR_PEP_ID=MMETSP0661-20131031/61676_1 /ASSEMBLY_ACC=CAM_ASM_000606 /TAXON_ID=109239 /ORGANISM="Alexandrium margalefi, Strain AMGDE01CS-322" /LENGTH=607 /DNA_ID=CAMNT_0051622591 /DNA_START=57 /DNA_END=1878 /DNA_ORIENTATION=-
MQAFKAELAGQAVLEQRLQKAGAPAGLPVEALCLLPGALQLCGLRLRRLLRKGGLARARVLSRCRGRGRPRQEDGSALAQKALHPALLAARVVRHEALEPRGDELRGRLLEVVDLLALEEVEAVQRDPRAVREDPVDGDHARGGDLPCMHSASSEAELARKAVLEQRLQEARPPAGLPVQALRLPPGALQLGGPRLLRKSGLARALVLFGCRGRPRQEDRPALAQQALDPLLLAARVVRHEALEPGGDELSGRLLEVVDLLALEEVEAVQRDPRAVREDPVDGDHARGGDLPEAAADPPAQCEDLLLAHEPRVNPAACEGRVDLRRLLRVRHEEVHRVGEGGVEERADGLHGRRRRKVPAVAEVEADLRAGVLGTGHGVGVKAHNLREAVDGRAQRLAIRHSGRVAHNEHLPARAPLRRKGARPARLPRLDVPLKAHDVDEAPDPHGDGCVLEDRKQRVQEDTAEPRARDGRDRKAVEASHARQGAREGREEPRRARHREDHGAHDQQRQRDPDGRDHVPHGHARGADALQPRQEHRMAAREEGHPGEDEEREDPARSRGTDQQAQRDLQAQKRDVVARTADDAPGLRRKRHGCTSGRHPRYRGASA